MELCSMLCARLDTWRMDSCLCIAGSLRCPPETTTKVLISYTPIPNNKFKVWKFFPSFSSSIYCKVLPTVPIYPLPWWLSGKDSAS